LAFSHGFALGGPPLGGCDISEARGGVKMVVRQERYCCAAGASFVCCADKAIKQSNFGKCYVAFLKNPH